MRSLLIFFGLAMLLFSGTAEAALTDSLIGYWNFTNDAADSSVRSNTWTVTGATHEPTGGILDGAYTFDGVNDELSFGDVYSNSDFSSGYTLCLWAYWGEPTDTNVATEFTSEGALGIQSSTTSNMRFTENGFVAEDEAVYTDVMPDGVWTYQCGIWDGTGIIDFYYNGVLNATKIGGADPDVDSLSRGNCIGSRNCWTTSVDFFIGTIDEVGLWSRNLSAQEVSDLWNGGIGLNPFVGASIDFADLGNNATSQVVTGDTVQWNVSITSAMSPLDTCWFTQNDTGTLTNSTVRKCDSGIVFPVNVTLTSTENMSVCGFYGANTSSAFEAQSSNSCFTVGDGKYFFNITALNRETGIPLSTINVTVNSSNAAFTQIGVGSAVFRLNSSLYSIQINTTSGFTLLPGDLTENTNISVNIPMFSIVQKPTLALETETMEYSIRFNLSDESQYSNVGLNYGGSLREPTRTSVGNEVYFNVSFSTPRITLILENVSFFWNMTLSSTVINTEPYNVTVSKLTVVSCSAADSGGNLTMNITYFNEQLSTFKIPASLEMELSLFGSDRNTLVPFNFNLPSQNSHLFCLRPSNSSVQGDIVLKYTADGGFTHYYYSFNSTFNNETVNSIAAYNFNDTTGVTDLEGTVRQPSTFSPVLNVIAKLERQYLGDGVFRIVQMSKSGSFGQVFFNIIEESEQYKISFVNGTTGNFLNQVSNLKFLCTAGVCQYTFLVTPGEPKVALPDFGTSFSFDNFTNILTVNWNDPNKVVTSVRVKVTTETFSSTTVICNDSYTGSSGSATCDVTGYPAPYNLQVFSTASPEIFNLNAVFGQVVNTASELFGGQSTTALFSGILLVMLGTAGAFAGVFTAGALVIIGLFITVLLGWVSFLGASIVLLLGIVTVIISSKVGKGGGRAP